MVEPAINYLDFADHYFAEYEIPDVQRITLVISPIVVSPSYFNFGDAGDVEMSPPITIGQVDDTGAELSKWDNIAEIDMLITATRDKGIRIPETPELRNYLSNFPDIREILPEVCNLTMERFSHNAQLSLELDPDTEGNELILYVRQKHYAEDFMDIIDDIRAKYRERLTGKRGWILVTTDFGSPE
ncbi:MAG: hypothetical protein ACLPOQ_07375 [Desulfobaccales bacterium]